MFKNLEVELARNSISRSRLSKELNLPQKELYMKLSGKTEFKLSEILIIQKMLPNCSLEYLFNSIEESA